MNLYFLVEGSSEFYIYPKWLSHLLPHFKRVNEYDQVTDNNYFIFNAFGQPAIIDEHLPNAIKDINLLESQGKHYYNYLLVCLDSEELTVDELREDIIASLKSNKNINLSSIKLVLIIQNRCIETWLLGNQNFVLTQAANIPLKYSEPFLTYKNHYDVRNQDPELMGIYNGRSTTHAQFHEEYLKSVFKARELAYSKGNPKVVGEKFYLDELIKRIKFQPNHLNSFQYFLSVIQTLQKH
jgi:hypothetical protein